MPSIIIVEREQLARILLEEALSDSGFDILLAGSSEVAIGMLEANDASLVGMVTDIELGGRTSGWDLARHARSLNADLAIVYVGDQIGDEWSAKGVPRSIFVEKPGAILQIVRALATLLGNEPTLRSA